jgi:gluconolactonase
MPYKKLITVSLLILSAWNNIIAQHDTTRRIVILDAEALKIIDSSTRIEVIAQGFKWTEGPLYIADGDYLLFSDIPNNKVYKWKEGQDTITYLLPSGFTGEFYKGKEPGSNGLLLNKNHELVLMQHGDRRVAKMKAPLDEPASLFTVLADNYRGKKLNSPNDGVFAADGSLYFTDPPYGLANGVNDSTKQLSFQGVYVLRPNGKLELFTDELKYPNGITLSPDGKYLFVSNSDPNYKIWMRYALDKNGLKKSGELFYRAKEDEGIDDGNPDGMKMNRAGYLFAAGPGGILVFDPSGKLIARIYTGRLTANCCFGKDEKTLFITCSDYVMRVMLK